ncbi:hypothetical protein [Planosporangium mesophilum]|uniref:Uncharacterized protein n=1 Tax=Planosporangium mesophilum TaxID=689768 RepID=A0A8J3X5Y2_9ACTN|nr:hypothetical protein [Planosporangium mesophilum]NJC83814.1 hypothetical protein [Planosporangium mesophilum]GII25188.1 hypothetical protein Pme01_47850 [Planosporangium mesophilum]
MSDEPKPPVPSQQPENGADETLGTPAAGAQEAASAPPAAKGRPGRVTGIVLAVVLGTATLLCFGGLGVGYFVYYRVSEPDRSTPAVVVRQYLQATFDDRDKSKAARFTCGRPEDIGDIEQKVADIAGREQRFGIHITVGWENFTAHENKQTATVSARLTIQVPEQTGQPSESFQNWNFAMRRQNGDWRVCGAQQTG